jgi:hypothetical protein
MFHQGVGRLAAVKDTKSERKSQIACKSAVFLCAEGWLGVQSMQIGGVRGRVVSATGAGP